jgi:hypothetical protein
MNPSAKSREWEFFRDESGRIAFNPKCNECARNCKQSFRAELVHCPVFVKESNLIACAVYPYDPSFLRK